MSLLELQKAQRRARILLEARGLMARRGWVGVTMRDLASASHVSVPTVYNLIGGKEALLGALMEDLFAMVSEAGVVSVEDVVSRARALWSAGLVPFLEAPEYCRELVCLFVSSRGTSELRRDHDERYVQLMATVISDSQRKGELSDLVSAYSLARTMYSLWIAQTIRWAQGDLDDEELRVAVDRGLMLLLLGVAEGDARAELHRLLKELPQTSTPEDRHMKGVA